MRLQEVNTRELEDAFILVNPLVNRSVTGYVRPLDKDIRSVFDEKKNKAFRTGKAARWILYNAQEEPIGRIAAFTNKKYKNKGDKQPTGGIGFFDCINNQEAADLLFDVARHWLINEGMEAMDGPINFGERDRWWGLVTEGFQSPLYGMNYNPPYYKDLFENYGFRVFYDQICFGLDPKKPLSAKTVSRHAEVASNPDFKATWLKVMDLEKCAADFCEVYNKAWAGHEGLKEMKKEQALYMFRQMKPIIDPKLIWFTYHQDKPIALFLNIPDLNQWFRYLDGKFGLWHKLKFLWIKKIKPNPGFTGLVFGIIPEFQGKGIDSFMIMEAYKVVSTLSYTTYEIQWIGDFNPRMVNVAENFGDTFRTRKLTTYRYLFDRTKPFERHPMV
jgi:GNAT superfamily N-acetyltransferase